MSYNYKNNYSNLDLNMIENGLILKAEGFSDRLFNKTRFFLPTIARLCLVATFMDDIVRITTEWTVRVETISDTWSFGHVLASVVAFLHLFGQILGCTMIILQKRVSVGCFALVLVIFFQALCNHQFFLSSIISNLALLGAVLMVFVDSLVKPRSVPAAGVPTLEYEKPKNIVQLGGRCLLMFLFLTLLEFESAVELIIQDVIGGVLMALVVLGYKTRLSAFVLMVILVFINFYENPWWLEPDSSPFTKDLLRYDFFHALTVVGGLLMVVLHGPGELSVDARKKQ